MLSELNLNKFYTLCCAQPVLSAPYSSLVGGKRALFATITDRLSSAGQYRLVGRRLQQSARRSQENNNNDIQGTHNVTVFLDRKRTATSQ